MNEEETKIDDYCGEVEEAANDAARDEYMHEQDIMERAEELLDAYYRCPPDCPNRSGLHRAISEYIREVRG